MAPGPKVGLDDLPEGIHHLDPGPSLVGSELSLEALEKAHFRKLHRYSEATGKP